MQLENGCRRETTGNLVSSSAAVRLPDEAHAARSPSIASVRPVLSTIPPGSKQRVLAFATVLVSLLIFLAAAPFAKTPLASIPAFLPAYQSALVINDVITAVLLFAQFAILRSPALLFLASAYLFSADMAVSHALSFPGLFMPGGMLGAGPQTTAWLYFLWHGGFPLLVVAYALSNDRTPVATAAPARAPGGLILCCVLAVLAAACSLTLLTTLGHDALPPIMQGDRDASNKVIVATVCWAFSLAALPMLWRRRPHSLLDLWLMVSVCAWIFDIALASVLNGGRYDLGWYAGRIYGLLASSFVLIVLLLENSSLHAQVVAARESERKSAQEALAQHAERLRIVHEIDRAIVAEVRPEAIAVAALQPLRELLNARRAIVNMIDDESGEAEWMAAAGQHRTHVGPGVRFPAQLLGNLDALKRGEPQLIDSQALPEGQDRDALLASGVKYYMAVPMIVGGELIGALSFGGEQNQFPETRVFIAQEVATQLAIAITQARLFERVKHQADELEQRVRERTSDLVASNKELESFSYSVSHDLRAPLRAVEGYAQMLTEDYASKLDEEGRRLLSVVSASAAQMGQLIDDLLKFSQIGRKSLAQAPVDMRLLASEVVAELSQAYPLARIELGMLPAAVGDRALLRQVWMNLIGNALKYSSRSDSPRVEIHGKVEAGESVFQVRDNGTGFDMRYQSKLFGVFQRLHRAEEFEGTGVGLAIVQRIVVRHGGRVWAEGAIGEGACFRFALPMEV